MSWILREKWYWTIVLLLITILIVPFFVVIFILILPPDIRLFMTILLVIGWGVAAGYKDWVTHKRKEEREQSGETKS